MKVEQCWIFIKHLLLLLILYLLQTSVFCRVRLWGVSPLILPLFAVGVGLFRGGLAGGCWGLVAGIMCDTSLGGTGLLFTVFLTVCGFYAGFFSQFILAKGFPSYFMISLSVLFLAAIFQMFRFLVYYGADPITLIRTGIFQTLYTIIFSVPVYLGVRWAARSKYKGKN